MLSKRCPKTHFISARRPSFGRLNLGPGFTLIYTVLPENFLREAISAEERLSQQSDLGKACPRFYVRISFMVPVLSEKLWAGTSSDCRKLR